jgi:hypothetical protein
MGVFATGRTIMAAFMGTTLGVRLGLAALAVQEGIAAVAGTAMWIAITGPVGLVVLAIATVIASVVLLYNKWAWFHRAVDKTYNLIEKVNAKTTIGSGKHKVSPLKNIAEGAVPGFGLFNKAKDLITGRATGGMVQPGETTLVGERGPEIARFPVGTRIEPRVATLSAPRMATVSRTGGGSAGAGRDPVHVVVHSTLKVDRKTLAKATSEAIADEKAGG